LFPWIENKIEFLEKPKYLVEDVFGEVVTTPEWVHAGEVSRYFDQKEKLWFAKIKGYAHYFEFLDFGITLGTDNPYDDSFVRKDIELFHRYKDENYDVVYSDSTFYVQKFEKNINQNFDVEFLKKQHLVD
jgi:hypothetical protein